MKKLVLDFVDGNSYRSFHLSGRVKDLGEAVDRVSPLLTILPIEPTRRGGVDLPHTVRLGYRVKEQSSPLKNETPTEPVTIFLESEYNTIGFDTQVAASDIALGQLIADILDALRPVGLYLGKSGGPDFLDLRTGENVLLEAHTPSTNGLTFVVCLNFAPKVGG